MKKLNPVTLTKRQLDRALLVLFAVDRPVIPRTAMSAALYAYAWTLWSQTSKGQKQWGSGNRQKRKTRLSL